MVSSWPRRAHGARRPASLFLSSISEGPARKSPLSQAQRACATTHNSSVSYRNTRNGLLSPCIARAERSLTPGTTGIATAPLARGVCCWSLCRCGESVAPVPAPARAPLHVRGQALQQHKRHFATLHFHCSSLGEGKSTVKTRCSGPAGPRAHVARGFAARGEGQGRAAGRGKALRHPRGCQARAQQTPRRCYSSQDDFGGGQHFPSSDQVSSYSPGRG